jgi:hypothetical protein
MINLEIQFHWTNTKRKNNNKGHRKEWAGHWCEVIKNKLILLSAHGFFFFFSWRSVLQSTNLPIKHYVKPFTNKHTHTHTKVADWSTKRPTKLKLNFT